jgi:hypothetical protein
MSLGVRDAIRNHPTAAAIAAIVVALGAVGYTLRSSVQGPPTASVKAFYTTDEGQTIFIADMNQAIPPFEHNGKPACRVWMYTCDGGKTRFPGYLERFTPEAKKRMEAARQGKATGASPMPGDVEVKKPGAGHAWVSRANTAEAAKVTAVTDPRGGNEEPEIVMP